MNIDTDRRTSGDLFLTQESSQEQLLTTLESMGDAFAAYDAEWRLIYLNEAASA